MNVKVDDLRFEEECKTEEECERVFRRYYVSVSPKGVSRRRLCVSEEWLLGAGAAGGPCLPSVLLCCLPRLCWPALAVSPGDGRPWAQRPLLIQSRRAKALLRQAVQGVCAKVEGRWWPFFGADRVSPSPSWSDLARQEVG